MLDANWVGFDGRLVELLLFYS